jgi:hypothetical protein
MGRAIGVFRKSGDILNTKHAVKLSVHLRELYALRDAGKMVVENPTWGAPRIHGELKMLGFDISKRTVLRWMRKAPRSPEPAKRGGISEQPS